jgi:GTP pyrophosphokinase
MYNKTHLTQSELEYLLHDKMSLVDLQRVMSAYEMARSVHEQQTRRDGTPYFYHCTRVCKIVIEELRLYDADLVCAVLLHDVLEDSKQITKEIISYNFGEYVSYVVETLTKDLSAQELNYDAIDIAHAELLKRSSEDCLIVRLAARLDNFRCLEFDLKSNPIKYVSDTSERYLPLAEGSRNHALHVLVTEMKMVRNKFLG